MTKRKIKNPKQKTKTKLQNDSNSLLALKLEGTVKASGGSNPSRAKKIKTVLPEIQPSRGKRKKREVKKHVKPLENNVCLPKVTQNVQKKKVCYSFSEKPLNGTIHNYSKTSMASKSRVKETKERLYAPRSSIDHIYPDESWSKNSSENQESGVRKADQGILPKIKEAELSSKVTLDQTQSTDKDRKMTSTKRKVSQHSISQYEKIAELQDSGIEESNGSGTSESAKISNHDDLYQDDFIFEEVTKYESGTKFNPPKKNSIHEWQRSRKTNTNARLNQVKLKSHTPRHHGNVLLTTEFKIEGIEIGLQDNTTRMAVKKKALKNVACVARRPKIPTRKTIEDGCGIYGSKVRGFPVDVDEYVIAVVRLYNCNDSVKEDALQDFPTRLCEGFS